MSPSRGAESGPSSERLGVAVLGATGSIGRSTASVLRAHASRFRVVALAAAGSDPRRLAAQAVELDCERVVVATREAADATRSLLPDGVCVEWGEEALLELVRRPEVDRVVAAMVGASGLPPVAAALEAGKDVALANKEALVAGGEPLMRLAGGEAGRLLPVDSEPVALDQALRCGHPREVCRLVLTASGGPLLERPLESLAEVTPEEAVSHPTWDMGRKISVDSATLMNKGLELLEAGLLFGFPGETIEIVIHPQSLVHSMVEFCDGSVVAQLGPHDMRVAIQYALGFPDRLTAVAQPLDLLRLGRLDFRPVEAARFPAVTLAREVQSAGGSALTVLSAANEVAVEAFLAGELRFDRIVPLVRRVVEGHEAERLESVEHALEWDERGRREARGLVR